MSAHTPGPWKNGRTADGRMVCFHVSPQPAGTFAPAERADPEHVANMRLLDTAPDMLDVLHAIELALQRGIDSSDILAPESPIRVMLVETIKKAAGVGHG